MDIRPYLPSQQLTLTVLSIALAGVLIASAQAYTAYTKTAAAQSGTVESVATNDQEWQNSLAQLQENSGVLAPEGPSEESLSKFLSAAGSSNVTETIGRRLLVNLTSKAQEGLGNDLPTQEQLIADANAQLNSGATAKKYAKTDLTLVEQNPFSLKAYGNAFIAALLRHPKANADDTLLAMGYTADYGVDVGLKDFPERAAQYRALARELVGLDVPAPLAPLHLQITNDFAAMADTYADMSALLTDPLRGISGLQRFQSLVGEEVRVFTNIAASLNKDGILFNKDEPGSAWAAFLSPQ